MGNISGTDFLWLIHYGLLSLYGWTLGCYVFYRQRFPEIFRFAKENPQHFNSFKIDEDTWQGFYLVMFLHVSTYGLYVVQAWPIWLIGLIVASFAADQHLEKVKPLIDHVKREGRGSHASQAQSGFQSQAPDDDDFFRYDGGNGGSSGKSSSRGSEHYGFDKRHPDDAKFWAVVDDPNATDGERRNAFDKILRAQAKRQGKAGRDVARQTA